MIDKSIRQGYRWGGPGGKSPGTSASGGTRGGPGPGGQGARGQATQNPGRTTKSAPSSSRQPGLEISNVKSVKTGPSKDMDDAREKAIHTAALTTKTETKGPHRDTKEQKKEQAEIDLGTLEKARTAPITLPKKYRKVPTRVPHRDDTVPTEIRDLYDPRGYERKGIATTGTMGERTWGEQAEAGIKRSGIMGTLGKIALGVVAPQLLAGTKLGTVLNWGNRLATASSYAKKAGLTETDIMSGLTGNITSNIGDIFSGKGTTKDTTTDTRDDRFGQGDRQAQAIAPKKDVITESVEKFSPRQMDLVRQRYEQLQQVIQTGMFGNRRLTADELAKLGGISKQMEAFLVDPQKMMMMARGGLAGLHG